MLRDLSLASHIVLYNWLLATLSVISFDTQAVRTAPEYGISVKNGGWKEKPKDSPLSVNVDLNRITERIDNIKEKIYEEDDSVEVLNEMGIEVIQGEARFRSNTDVSVRMTKQNDQDENKKKEIQQVSAKRGILIATGATAIRQPKFVTGLDTIRYMTYEEVFQDLLSPSVERKELPKRITLVGGGPIGCEMAQAFSRLGSEVSLIAERYVKYFLNDVSCRKKCYT